MPPTPQPHATMRCPKCRQSVITLWTEGDWQFYRCATHGVIVVSPEEQDAATDEPDDSRIRR